MKQRAKLFINGRSQAVRLPAAYRFDTKEIFIRKDAKTGEVILSRRPSRIKPPPAHAPAGYRSAHTRWFESTWPAS